MRPERIDVGAVGELDRPPHVLLDQQNGRPDVADLLRASRTPGRPGWARGRAKARPAAAAAARRSAHGRSRAAAAHRRTAFPPAADRSCAGPGSGRAPAPARRRCARGRASAVPPSARFSATVSVVKMCLPSSTRAMPRLAMSSVRSPTSELAEVGDVAAGERDEADDRCKRRGLAGAVRADETDDLAFVDLEVEVLDRGCRAVAHGQVTNAEHRLPERRDRRVSTAGSVRISAGVPSAIVLPSSSTWMLLGELHDQAHVVLDHEQAHVERVPDRGERADELVRLALVETGGGLVEQ